MLTKQDHGPSAPALVVVVEEEAAEAPEPAAAAASDASRAGNPARSKLE